MIAEVLKGVCDSIAATTTGWKTEIGFNTDVDAWVQANVSTGRTILVTLDSETPRAMTEDGKVRDRRYVMALSVFMRARADEQTFLSDIAPTYEAMRDALDGLRIKGASRTWSVTIGPGSAGIASGFAVSALQLTVQ